MLVPFIKQVTEFNHGALNLMAKNLCKFEDAVPIMKAKLHDCQFVYLLTCLVPQLQGMGTEIWHKWKV